jgi:hypothetical protein
MAGLTGDPAVSSTIARQSGQGMLIFFSTRVGPAGGSARPRRPR